MAEGVVDPFEVVDVEQQEGQRVTVARGSVDLRGHRLLEMPAVPGAGQQVRARQLLQGAEEVPVHQEVVLRVALQEGQEPLDLGASSV